VAHRAILDVRVFGYADVTLPLDGGFFLSDLARSIVTRQPLLTTPEDMMRDYAGAEELATLIQCWEKASAPNTVLDLYTKMPVSKFDLLEIARSRYALEIQIQAEVTPSPTGLKPVYASRNHAASTMGYSPRRSAVEVVIDFLDAMVAAYPRQC
jgi:nucleoside-diphosphate-sugar epimerase